MMNKLICGKFWDWILILRNNKNGDYFILFESVNIEVVF